MKPTPGNKPVNTSSIRLPQLRLTHFLPDGDDLPCPTTKMWGHNLENIDCSDTLRIVLQNPNGIKLNPLDFGDFAFSMKVCHTMGAGIICLSESNVNWNLTYLQNKVSNTVRNIWETSALQHSQHPEPYLHQSQRGGTLQIITDRWVSRIQSKGMDPYGLGRWSYMILQGKGDRSVAIITAYRSCKSTFDSAGDTTSYMQQYRSLLQYNTSFGRRSTPDPHRQFVLDLQAWISKLRSDNISIILSLDSNEDTTDRKGNFYPLEFQEGVFPYAPNHDGSMATLAATCGLLDVLSHFHPPPYPSTYARGKNRLDYIYMSDDIIHSALRSGILPIYSVFTGDHNACYVDIDTTLLFSESTYQIAPPQHTEDYSYLTQGRLRHITSS
jgi:hypothetical protein